MEYNKIAIWDFDSTLVETDSKVILKKHNGTYIRMSSQEYASYKVCFGDKFDYSEFQRLINPQPIEENIKKLTKMVSELGKDRVIILTSRSNKKPIKQFIKLFGLPKGIKVVTLDDSGEFAKSVWITNYLSKHLSINEIEFWDDNENYINNVKALETKELKITVHKV